LKKIFDRRYVILSGACEVKELILRVRSNDQDAFAQLIEQYRPLIESSVYLFSSDPSFSLYKDDLLQEASVGFYNSILAYDLEQTGVEFGLFAKICIRNALVSQLRALKKCSTASMEDIAEIPTTTIDTEDPLVRILEQERLKSLYTVIRKNLSDLEYKIWQMHTAGWSASDMALALKTNEKSVNNAVYRVRKKLRALLRQSSDKNE
jgi:RNA polymerase sporulation-specific sigma factor